MNELRAIIFDFDGVIADTEPLHFAALQRVLAGIDITLTEAEYYADYLGFDDRACFLAALRTHRREASLALVGELMDRKAQAYLAAVKDHLAIFPGVRELVQDAAARVPLAIASGALRNEIDVILQEAGLRKAFCHITSAEDVTRGKPAPDPFLHAMAGLNRQPAQPTLTPEDCLVIEDSLPGIRAARAAGMKVLAVANTHTVQDLGEADAITHSLADTRLADLQSRLWGAGPRPRMNICSLVPGATEVVAALGLEDRLVGISHECDTPGTLAHVPVMVRGRIDSHRLSSAQIDAQVGELLSGGSGLYELDEARLLAAKPDLLITQDLCEVCAITPAQVARVLRTLSPTPRMVTLNPHRLEDVLCDIERLGAAMEREEAGKQLADALRRRLDAVRATVRAESRHIHVACLEWLSPLYSAGHWVPDMVEAAGGTDALATAGLPSGRIEWEALAACAPDVIVLMPCGFTVARTKAELAAITHHPEWQHLPAVQRGEVYLVDALSYFSRPGPRLVEGVEQLAAILHPSCYDRRLPAAVERLAMPETSTPIL